MYVFYGNKSVELLPEENRGTQRHGSEHYKSIFWGPNNKITFMDASDGHLP